jgi:hypothetical protein
MPGRDFETFSRAARSQHQRRLSRSRVVPGHQTAGAAASQILVANNAIEFRGRYREVELHPGVLFPIPSVRGVNRCDYSRLR